MAVGGGGGGVLVRVGGVHGGGDDGGHANVAYYKHHPNYTTNIIPACVHMYVCTYECMCTCENACVCVFLFMFFLFYFPNKNTYLDQLMHLHTQCMPGVMVPEAHHI